MFNHILWSLDNEMDDAGFERLCTDLLGREGYKDIVPIGGARDRGRDAEIRLWKGIKTTGGVTFFQYSLENGWEGKLKRELNKVQSNGHQIDFYVFVTSQRVTGEKRDKLEQMVAASYKWQLLVYDREWLRHRLEEAHPDLAAKYLGVAQSSRQSNYSTEIKPVPALDSGIAWKLYSEGYYEAAAVELKRLLKKNKEDVEVWQALAWCQYSLFRYSEALLSVDRAIALRENDELSWILKACVLTEDGIAKGSKVNLLLARDIFRKAANKSTRWVDHFNYGNVLHALGENEEAKKEYLAALHHDEQQAEYSVPQSLDKNSPHIRWNPSAGNPIRSCFSEAEKRLHSACSPLLK